jgi:hypothetical protein
LISEKLGTSDGGSCETRCVHTLSPALKLFTLRPTASMIPAPSEQGTTPGMKPGRGIVPLF